MPPRPRITWLRVKASVVPSDDHVGCASPPVNCPAGGTILPRIAPETASAMRMLLGPAASPTPPGEVLVNASLVPSGENVGSVSQSRGPRPASGTAASWVPSASASQIRSTRSFALPSKRVTTIRRPSGV